VVVLVLLLLQMQPRQLQTLVVEEVGDIQLLHPAQTMVQQTVQAV
jgi:hypothetical protein